MSVLVAQQDESIDYIQNTAQDIEQDASKGYVTSGDIPPIIDVIFPVSSTQIRRWCPQGRLAKSGGFVLAFSSSCWLSSPLLLLVSWSPTTTRSNSFFTPHFPYTVHTRSFPTTIYVFWLPSLLSAIHWPTPDLKDNLSRIPLILSLRLYLSLRL